MSREFDVVLFGPTGVTGREVARHLGRRAPVLGLRWAVAGRSRERMEGTLVDVGAEPDAILLADVNDDPSIQAMVASGAVVANLVGPYASYGEPVVAACAGLGTHHLDLTGELDWVRSMIDRYGRQAVGSGAKLVPTAGFEALPFDLATLLAARTLHERTGEAAVAADAAVAIHRHGGLVAGLSDMVSGGTYASMVEAIRRGASRDLTDPYLLDPPSGGVAGPHGTTNLLPHRHRGTGDWLAPMLPSPYLNPPVVHRSAALLRGEGESVFGPSFRYREGMAVSSLLPPPMAELAAAVVAGMLAGTQAALGLAGRAPLAVRGSTAQVLGRMGPRPGQGPRPETLDDWTYQVAVRATTASDRHADVLVEAVGHPGYKSTAMMVGEAALALADPTARLPDRRGFLTPATALGLLELDRFEEAGLGFRIA